MEFIYTGKQHNNNWLVNKIIVCGIIFKKKWLVIRHSWRRHNTNT